MGKAQSTGGEQQTQEGAAWEMAETAIGAYRKASDGNSRRAINSWKPGSPQ